MSLFSFYNIKTSDIFLFFGMMYTLIPFETSNPSLSILIRLLFAMSITLFALYSNKFKININYLFIVTIILIINAVFIAAIQSLSLRFFVFLGSIAFSIIFATIIQNNISFKNKVLFSLKAIILLSVSTLFIQIIIYKFTNNLIQFHEIFFPLSHARFAFQDNFGIVRMGGMYLEPGTYANYLYMLLMVFIIINKKISHPLVFLSAVSIIFTYSIWGMISGLFLLIIAFIDKFKYISIKSKLFLIIVILLASTYSVKYISNSGAINFAIAKLNGDIVSGSVSSKKDTYDEFKENFLDYMLYGDGFDPNFRKGESSVQDSGLLLNMTIIFGLLFTILITFIYMSTLLKWYGIKYLILMAPLVFSKVYYWDYIFWLLFFLVLSGALIKEKNNQFNKRIL